MGRWVTAKPLCNGMYSTVFAAGLAGYDLLCEATTTKVMAGPGLATTKANLAPLPRTIC